MRIIEDSFVERERDYLINSADELKKSLSDLESSSKQAADILENFSKAILVKQNRTNSLIKNFIIAASVGLVLFASLLVVCLALLMNKPNAEKTITEIRVEIEPIDILEETESEEQSSIEEPTKENLIALKDIPTNMYCFMDYRKITDKTSNQYKLQTKCATGNYGIRTYEGKYYAAALGSYFSNTIGDTFHVVLENGTEFDIIVGDCKDNGDAPYYGHPTINYDKQECVNVIEFIVDENEIPGVVIRTGTFSAIDIFGGLIGNGGNIKSMEYTGRINIKDIL